MSFLCIHILTIANQDSLFVADGNQLVWFQHPTCLFKGSVRKAGLEFYLRKTFSVYNWDRIYIAAIRVVLDNIKIKSTT